ncbi:MAG: hypothetical protein ACO2OX_04500, partial [Candidatus Nanopusillus sp.]
PILNLKTKKELDKLLDEIINNMDSIFQKIKIEDCIIQPLYTFLDSDNKMIFQTNGNSLNLNILINNLASQNPKYIFLRTFENDIFDPLTKIKIVVNHSYFIYDDIFRNFLYLKFPDDNIFNISIIFENLIENTPNYLQMKFPEIYLHALYI